MKRFLILSALFLLLAGAAQAQVEDNKGVSRTGGIYNGQDWSAGQTFSTRRGNDTLYPRVSRTGELLEVTASIASCEIPGCGITDKEALVNVTISWNGNYISRITKCGLIYSIHGANEWIKKDSSVSVCGNTTIQLKLQQLSPNSIYDVRAFVVLLSDEDTVKSVNTVSLVTKKHYKCGGWVPNANEHKTDLDSFDLVKDHKDNLYGVVQIGNRCWMRENMRATTSLNGDDILNNSNPSSDLREARWSNSNAANDGYGVLYNWYAAADISSDEEVNLPPNHRGICPEGWHLPTTEEWTAMENALNNNHDLSAEKAGLLAGGCDWAEDNNDNSSPGNYQYSEWGKSGFEALPAGLFNEYGISGSGENAFFWTSSEQGATLAYHRFLQYSSQGMNGDAVEKGNGLSVRCIRNIPTFAIHWKKNDDCTYQVYSTLPGIPHNSLTYKWKINNGEWVSTGTDSILTFTLKEETDNYHIVCEATRPGDYFTASTDIVLTDWPPILTVLCSDSFATAIKVSPNGHVASASWFNSNNVCLHENITTGYVPLEPGKNSVRLTNSTGACRPDTVKVAITTCFVANPNGLVERSLNENEYLIDALKDKDKNLYAVVQIGNRCWMRENMRSKEGLSYGNTSETGGTIGSSDPLYYNYSPQNAMPLEQRGYLYNYEAADMVCPEGWHLPSFQEWTDLVSAVMGTDHKTCMMAGGCDWSESNIANAPGNYQANNRNASGLTIVPSGNLESNGSFAHYAESSRLWASGNTYRVAFFNNQNVMNKSDISNVLDKVAYSVRCIRNTNATNMLGQCFVPNPNENDNETQNNTNPYLIDAVQDVSGISYGVVQIAGRCWTKENLRVNSVPGVNLQQLTDGNSQSSPAYYVGSSTSIDLQECGYLYNWYAANVVCPAGWRLPTRDEWKELADTAVYTNKLAGDKYWHTEDCNSTVAVGSPCKCNSDSPPDDCNSLGFTLVPAGNTNGNGTFQYIYKSANFWTKDEIGDKAYRIFFNHNKNKINDGSSLTANDTKKRGLSVRCIRKQPNEP